MTKSELNTLKHFIDNILKYDFKQSSLLNIERCEYAINVGVITKSDYTIINSSLIINSKSNRFVINIFCEKPTHLAWFFNIEFYRKNNKLMSLCLFGEPSVFNNLDIENSELPSTVAGPLTLGTINKHISNFNSRLRYAISRLNTESSVSDLNKLVSIDLLSILIKYEKELIRDNF